MAQKPFILAVDGPAASGKGTLARKLAEHFEMPYLDTGLLYRGVGYHILQSDDLSGLLGKESLSDGEKLQLIACAATFSIPGIDIRDNQNLRNEEVGKAASVIAKIPEIRSILLNYQRKFADKAEGAVLDGRDIGTVICPDAHVKLFITASPEERARRRTLELTMPETEKEKEFQKILSDIRKRDEQDTNRASAPLKKAEDAYLLDTTNLSIEEAYESALQLINEHLSQHQI